MKNTPYISIANFIEYASGASAARRTDIIEQYHDPQVFKFDWHGSSDQVFVHGVHGSPQADALIEQEKRRQKALLTGDKIKDRGPKHILEMMELFETSDLVRVADDCVLHPTDAIAPDLVLNGLTIRIAPSLMIEKRRLGWKEKEVGFVKAYLGKSGLSEEAAKLYCVAVQMHAEAVLTDRLISPELCRAYSLYSDKLHTAPKNQKNRRKHLTAAAQEIVDRWDIVGRRLAEKHSNAGQRRTRKG